MAEPAWRSYAGEMGGARIVVALTLTASCSAHHGGSAPGAVDAEASAVAVPGAVDASVSDGASGCASAAECPPGQICCVTGNVGMTMCQSQTADCSLQACATSGECLMLGQSCQPGPLAFDVCAVKTCPQGQSTTISGTVYDPANERPVYDAVVYVPATRQVAALPDGVACISCGALYGGNALAGATTDATGHFSMTNAPPGEDVPLIVQIGKWRMAYAISVAACEANPQPDHSLRLPRNHLEGNLPNLAVSTGGEDSLECLLLRMGIDPSEYTGGALGAGRVHVFTGYGGAVTQDGTSPDPSAALWDSDKDIDQFDIVLLSCEGLETKDMNQQVLWDYANAGGRVLASHYHYAWFNTGPFASASPAIATWTAGANAAGSVSSTIATVEASGFPFPAGPAMSTWLGTLGALGVDGAPAGELVINDACHNVDVSTSNSKTQVWLSADETSIVPEAPEAISFDTPVGDAVEGTCGEVIYTDMHVSGGQGGTARGSLPPDYASDAGAAPICPDQCATGTLSPQEEALEFMLLHLDACEPPSNPQPLPEVPVTDQ
jgi:hypothetical protein